ncbi:MAG: alpha/beta hydrolase [Opitutaceae bacterium]|tara:strand:- start:4468 stop:5631 length:1164 start_codon:yes stop_codon:yes gene_type:complete
MFLSLAVALFALSLLTWVKAWNTVVWKAAIVAGEFGHYLGLVTLVLVCVIVAYGAVMVGEDQPYWRPAGIAVVLALAATGFFLSPVAFAMRVGQGLPAKLQSAFDTKPSSSRVVDLRRLWVPLPAVQPVRVKTHTFTPIDWPEALKLDFYATEQPGAPVVVVVHGGGWDSGDREQLTEFNHWLAGEGYNVAAISYRLAPKYPWPAQREDTLLAIDWLKANASELHIDATRLVLMGRSAGAQIASAVAYGAPDPAVRGLVGLYGAYDMNFVWSISRPDDVLNSTKLMNQYLDGAPTPANQTAYDSASAQGMVRSGQTPPTLLMHGTVDSLCWVKHSQRLAERLDAAGVPHVYVELPWAVHAFDYNLTAPGGQLTAYAVREFLATVCRR